MSSDLNMHINTTVHKSYSDSDVTDWLHFSSVKTVIRQSPIHSVEKSHSYDRLLVI